MRLTAGISGPRRGDKRRPATDERTNERTILPWMTFEKYLHSKASLVGITSSQNGVLRALICKDYCADVRMPTCQARMISLSMDSEIGDSRSVK